MNRQGEPCGSVASLETFPRVHVSQHRAAYLPIRQCALVLHKHLLARSCGGSTWVGCLKHRMHLKAVCKLGDFAPAHTQLLVPVELMLRRTSTTPTEEMLESSGATLLCVGNMDSPPNCSVQWWAAASNTSTHRLGIGPDAPALSKLRF